MLIDVAFALIIGFFPALGFYRLKWLDIYGSLIMGLFLSITFYVHWIMFALFILAGAVAFTLLLNNHVEQNARLADLSLTQSLADQMKPLSEPSQISAELTSWMDIIGGERPIAALVVDESHEVVAEYKRGVAFGTTGDWTG